MRRIFRRGSYQLPAKRRLRDCRFFVLSLSYTAAKQSLSLACGEPAPFAQGSRGYGGRSKPLPYGGVRRGLPFCEGTWYTLDSGFGGGNLISRLRRQLPRRGRQEVGLCGRAVPTSSVRFASTFPSRGRTLGLPKRFSASARKTRS